ncbi:ABC transporter permease [Hylemonella gracilis]|uniref:Transport permease protein n=1 Tax=Hylemonella gracilis ATCC 19624 TaxID=887062 RepID=F3KSE9_9BURK|nr:ABC transporter permease [Hylemonella gracilis]EGI77343.1 ABC-2 type transporter [Hylemonella gracilis ATCC 19624]
MTLFRILWGYRGFILGSVQREFQLKYRHSVLGMSWVIINPLAMITVYTVIFANVMRAKLPGIENTFGYSIYLCAGLLTWGLFTEIASRGLITFIEHANMLKKVSFPRLALPVIVVLNASVNFAIVFGLFALFLLLTGNFPGWPSLALFPLLALLVVFAIGLGVTLGVLNVFFRDVGHLFGLMLTFWFWLTPIVYPLSILPAWAQPWLNLNPLTPVMAAFQCILVTGQWPHWPSLWWPAFAAFFFCVLGLQLYRKRAGEMTDEL